MTYRDYWIIVTGESLIATQELALAVRNLAPHYVLEITASAYLEIAI